MKKRGERVPTPVLLSYLDAELSADEAAAIERISVDSESVRRRLDALRTLRRALQAPVVALESREVSLRAAAAEVSAPARTAWWLAAPGWQALAAATLLVLGVGIGQVWPRAEELAGGRDGARAKSGVPSNGAARWAGVQAFRLGAPGASPERLRGQLRQQDGLLFAYTNLGDEPFERLMVFSVDAQGEVHWFYPAYANERDNPTSVPIEVGQQLGLADVVFANLPAGPLTIYAAFTRQPLDVKGVEGWLRLHPEGGAGFAGSDAVVSQLAVTVAE